MKKSVLIALIACVYVGSFSLVLAQDNATSVEERMNAWEHHCKLKEESPFKDLKWRVVGPEFCGGRIEAIACHPDEPYTVYVGAGSGNLWKTKNNGTTWEPIFENESTFAIGCVTIAPSDPDIVWVGTGEVLMARSSYAGTGVFKSTDAGKTWQNMGLYDSHHVPQIVIDPENPDVVYVAALGHNYGYNEERGVYKTMDGGKTWEKVLYISEKAGIVEIVMDPSDNKTLYAAAWERDRKAWDNVICGEGSGLYKTTDAGRTWQRLTEGLPIGENVGRFGLAIAPSNPNVVYALLDNHEPPPEGKRRRRRGEVYRSDDKGKTWRKMHEDGVPTAIGYDFCLVRVAPDNQDEIFVLGNKLLHSTDGGKTYEEAGETIVHVLSHDIRVNHLDMHAMWIDPKNPDRLILGNDGGVYMSYDRGGTWLHLNNFPIGEFYAVWVDMDEPYNIYGGTQDNAALFGPSTHNVEDRLTKYGVEDPWKHVYLDRWGGGDSYFTYRDPVDHDIIYYEHQFGVLRRKSMKTGETKDIMPKAKEDEPRLRYNWMTPYFISKYDPSTLYYAAHKVFKSPNRGDSWTCISPDLTTNPGPERQGDVPYGTITMLSESPFQQGLIYAGTDDGNVQVTRDDGKTWALVRYGLPAKWVSRVIASQHELGTVYVTLTGYREDDFEKYVYMSEDFGKTWKSISGNLPSEGINVIREDPRDKNILYVGTELGVYVTLDGGGAWHSLCNHLPTTPVHDLVIHPREYELVIATHGRSFFILDVNSIKGDGSI
ncbi:MAG: hypothetical protein JSV17_00125 [Candidatus Aminicenantes bacterium]|nr:MAG: hypothetical protein JSV17_00125 [Candidatus Aminicenantes bacterium]